MALLNNPMDRCLAMRFYLENQFPKLAFHFYRDTAIDPDRITVRVMRRDEKGSYAKAARDKEWMVELVDPDTFPDDLFITKCCLIA